MANRFVKTQKICGTCAHWLGPRAKSGTGFVMVESVSAECDAAFSKAQQFSFQQRSCTVKPGWNLWKPLH